MEASYASIITLLFLGAVLVLLAWKASNWVWFRPGKLEKCLRQQGFRGNPYRFLYGDLKEISTLYKEAHSKPISLSDNVVQRIMPHFIGAVKKYGKTSYLWLGPKATVLILDPELIKEVAQKINGFQKPHSNPLAKYLAQGILVYDGDKWVKQENYSIRLFIWRS